AEPRGPPNPNHKPYDATTASVVRLLGCDASIVLSVLPMLLIASLWVPCDPPSLLINTEIAHSQLGPLCRSPAAEKHPWVIRTDGFVTRLCRVNAAGRPRRECR